MRWLAWPVVCLLCLVAMSALSAGKDDAEKPAEEPLDLETILNTTVDKEAYVDVSRCISRHKIRDVTIIDDKHVAFRISRDKYYLVVLAHRCPMLERDSTLSYETRGARVCVGDSLRGVIRYGTITRIGPACYIPGFQEITREQLVLIKDSVRGKRRGS